MCDREQVLIECARLFSASLSSAGRGAAAGLAGAVRCWMWVRGAARGSAGHQGADLFYFIRRDHCRAVAASRAGSLRGPRDASSRRETHRLCQPEVRNIFISC